MSYSPQTQRHQHCLNQMLVLQQHTGGQIKLGNKGYPALVFFSPATKYVVSYYDDTNAFVLWCTSRSSTNDRQQLKRSRHVADMTSYINYLFGG